MKESDWDEFLERLLKGTKSAIDSFAAEHPNEEVCYFAFDSDPQYGDLLTCFNTTQASNAFAREQLEINTAHRRELLDNRIWVDSSYNQVKAYQVLPFCNNTGDFEYQGYTKIRFPEWMDYYSLCLIRGQADEGNDYLSNRVARLFCRAIDRLVDEHYFERLLLARPTLLGFGFHDDDHLVVHMLNFPAKP